MKRLICWLIGHRWEIGPLGSEAAFLVFCERCGSLNPRGVRP